MNKNWIILLLVTVLTLEYKTGYRKVISVPENYKITYPTTVIKLKGKARGHRKYIDMRLIEKIFETEGTKETLVWKKSDVKY